MNTLSCEECEDVATGVVRVEFPRARATVKYWPFYSGTHAENNCKTDPGRRIDIIVPLHPDGAKIIDQTFIKESIVLREVDCTRRVVSGQAELAVVSIQKTIERCCRRTRCSTST